MSTDRIEKEILLHAPIERVWRALSDSQEFGTWFGIKFATPFVAGTPIRGFVSPSKADTEMACSQEPYAGLAFDITIEKMERDRMFSFRWHPFAVERGYDYSAESTTLIVFTLEPVDGGVLLTVTESGFDKIPLERRAKAFTANEHGWAVQMKAIEKYLAHAPQLAV